MAQETGQSLGLELLADIQDIFAERDNPEALKTQVIIDALKAMDDRPWPTFTKGDKPITPHRLARMLRDFDVQKPRKERDGDETFRGYRLDAFADAFTRYLPPKAEQAEQTNETGHETAKTKAEHNLGVPHSKTAISPDKYWSVPLVPLSTPDRGEQEDDDAAVYGGA
jgi:hypothetical protein